MREMSKFQSYYFRKILSGSGGTKDSSLDGTVVERNKQPASKIFKVTLRD
jgi:hypothetical protein